MISIFDGLRDITFASVLVRMILSVLCGGLIGIERAYKRRPAGFRTHILICLGADLTAMTGQFLLLKLNYYTDVARLGAQAIAGIGFIGAGAIIVTGNKRVKGLTTAAGLWVSAIIGLALGAGYYEGGLGVTVIVLFAEIFFPKIEKRVRGKANEFRLYMEYMNKKSLKGAIALFNVLRVKIQNVEVTRVTGSKGYKAIAIFSLRISNNMTPGQVVDQVKLIEGVVTAEEM